MDLQRADSVARSNFELPRLSVVLIIAFSCLAPVLASILLLSTGNLYFDKYFLDLLIAIDGGYRVAQGQIPHVDFHAPMGALNYWIAYLGFFWAGPLWTVPIVMMILAGLSVGPLLLYAALTRLDLFASAIVGLVVTFLIATPVVVGSENYAFGMLYNNYGWAILLLLSIFAVEPHRTNVAHRWDFLFLAVLMAILLYSKASFFVAGIFVALPLLMTAGGRMSVLWGALVVASFTGALELFTEIPSHYVRDLLRASEASGVLRPSVMDWMRILLVQNGQEVFVCVLVPVTILALGRALDARRLAWILCLTGASLFALQQNYQGPGMPSLIAVPVIARAALQTQSQYPGAYPLARRDMTVPIALAVLIGAFPYYETRGIKYLNYFLRSANATSLEGHLEGFAPWEPKSSALLFHEIGETEPEEVMIAARYTPHSDYIDEIKNYTYAVALLEGVQLAVERCTGSIATFGFFNPFNLLLGRDPLSDEMVLHLGRTFSRDRYPSFEDQYGESACFLVPKVTLSNGTAELLQDLYREPLQARYEPAEESNYWTLWTRKDG